MTEKTLLFLNACVHKESSRTMRLARPVVERLGEGYETREVDLEHTPLAPLDSAGLARRGQLQAQGRFDAPEFEWARQFATADRIVIAAPYWDFGFPASLKLFLEAIGIAGVVYRYSEEGRPVGLCHADRLVYVTTRGGFVPDEADLGFKTVESTARFYGIPSVSCVAAQGLDIPTTDVDAAIAEAAARAAQA